MSILENRLFLTGSEKAIRGAAFHLLGILAASPNGNRLLYEGLSLKSPNLYAEVRSNFSMTIEEFDPVLFLAVLKKWCILFPI